MSSSKLTIHDIQKFAEAKNGKCLSREYINSKNKLLWKCEFGHQWETTYGSVRSGNWCSVCAGNKKLSIEDMRDIAQKLGGKCISEKYINNRTKLIWECAHGHRWPAKPTHIKDGHWCPECEGNKKLTLEDMELLAESFGGKCLSDSYVNAFTKIKWECANGHQWGALPLSARKGHWCSTCSSGIGERICRAFLEQIFGEKFPNTMPKWLINNEGNLMELDGYCASLKIAFEHHGEQHYSENSIYARGPIFLAKRKKDDLLKEKLCKEKGIHLIVIPEIPKRTSLEELKPLIKNQLNAYGISIPVNFDEIPVDLKKAYTTPEFIHQYMLLTDIANSRVGQCLSKTYKGNHTRLQWKCNVCGISWLATPASIKSGSWCPKCSSKKGTEKRKLSIDLMKQIAKERRGKCLSSQYINANSKLKWECANGHQWFATPHMVKNSGTWCPECYNIRRKK
ncbi:hypothetical protein ACFLZQ_07360 [Thermodesulfobacteriota bacterium]